MTEDGEYINFYKKADWFQCLEFFIEGHPVPFERPRYNPKSGHFFTSGKHRKYMEKVRDSVRCQLIMQNAEVQKMEGVKVSLFLKLYLPRPKTQTKKQKAQRFHIKRPDSSNFTKSIEDALEGVLYKDDAQIAELHVEKLQAYPDEPIGVKILIIYTEL